MSKTLPLMINETDNKIHVGHFFFSRRNKVELIDEKGRLCVRKTYSDTSFAVAEQRNYKLLIKRKAEVLLPIRMGENELILPYVSGMTGLELLETQEKSKCFCEKQWDGLAKWCCDFYKKSGLVFGEPHLRNFILEKSSGAWYGIDFEESQAGDIAHDYGKLMAYILSYYPQNTLIKKKIFNVMSCVFLEEMLIKKHALHKAQKQAAKVLASRRKQRLHSSI